MSARKIGRVFKTAAADWWADKAPRLGAALAFYTLFSLAPLVILIVTLLGFWMEDAGGYVVDQFRSLLGEKGAETITSVLDQPGEKKQGILATVAAGFTLMLGAAGVFLQLQDALNSIWEVKPSPGGFKKFVMNRLLSFAMVLVIGFLLLVSLVLTAAVAVASKYMSGLLPGWEVVAHILSFLLSFGVITVLFALIFKYLPDVKIAWRDVWLGAVFTAFLFTVGKFFLGMYLGRSAVASYYGAAGSLVLVLIWVYYSGQILFFGAEMTQAFAAESGRKPAPKEHAETASAEEARGEPAGETHPPRTAPVPSPQPAFIASAASVAKSRPFPPAPAFLMVVLLVVPWKRLARRFLKV